ncbi:TPA: hypothetical protein N0F65_009988 [Lagenidium giganteum]|uniref:Roadblock/LAMTOR2 domain-containing protein n=1 Tax=Lagenidium giganteum TaxID=4803 RepID=A0AAV2ZHA2_9STRA|nr:TPA: hypothetical protein N0F65_009988 [Lagenidium giganteum]
MSARPFYKRPLVLLGGALVYAGTAGLTYLTLYDPKKSANLPKPLDHHERLRVFNANAAKYDAEVSFDEMMVGISLMRRFLLGHAHGRVLEVAAGTGRNVTYYPQDTQLTLTDFSDGMLAQIPASATQALASCEQRVMSADALEFSDESFDAVVDTFGLCSMDDPVDALREMQRVCKRDGKILLLEHGRSHYAWLSSILDKFADLHAQRWGCSWNRDIVQLVQQAGLEIEMMHRFHFGTTYYIIAKPSGKPVAPENARERESGMSEVEETLERVKNHKGVEGYVIADRNGNVLRRHPQMALTEAERYANYMRELTTKARGVVRDLNPKNDLQYLRVRVKKLELLVAHGKRPSISAALFVDECVVS